MMQRTMSGPIQPTRIYYRTRRRVWHLIIIACLLMGAVVNIMTGLSRHRRWDLVAGIVLFAEILLLILMWRSTSLTVTPDGLRFRNGFAILFAPWDDMEFIGRGEQRWWSGGIEGIQLREARWRGPRWSRMRQNRIPLWDRYSGPWWDRAVLDDIFYHAPWLAGDGKGATVSR